jgi:CRP-like cAMP-binding protein
MRLDEAAAVLSQAEFFDICDAEQKRLLAFASERRRFAPDDVVCQGDVVPEGAHVLIVGTLKAKPVGAIAGKPYTISNPGAVISAMALILARPRLITVTAVIETDMLFVPRAAFRKLVEQSPDLAARAAAHIEKDLAAYLGALAPVGKRMKGER